MVPASARQQVPRVRYESIRSDDGKLGWLHYWAATVPNAATYPVSQLTPAVPTEDDLKSVVSVPSSDESSSAAPVVPAAAAGARRRGRQAALATGAAVQRKRKAMVAVSIAAAAAAAAAAIVSSSSAGAAAMQTMGVQRGTLAKRAKTGAV